jgi:cation transport ATPase
MRSNLPLSQGPSELQTANRNCAVTRSPWLGWASVYNLLAIPIAACVFYPLWHLSLRPEVSALLMSASSIIVAVNAVMLRRSEGSLLVTSSR